MCFEDVGAPGTIQLNLVLEDGNLEMPLKKFTDHVDNHPV